MAGSDPITWPPEEWRGLLGVEPQAVQHFSGAVFNNLILGDGSVSREHVPRAAATVSPGGLEHYQRRFAALPNAQGIMPGRQL